MANIKTLNIRPSDVVLDRVLNPADDSSIASAYPGDILEACGIIPDFFCAACIMASNSGEPVTLDAHTAATFGGALPWIKRRLLVPEDVADKARRALAAGG